MINDRILQLLARKLTGESSAAESAELERLLASDPEAIYYVELINQLWEDQKVKGSAPPQTGETDMAYLKHIAKHGPVFQNHERPAIARSLPHWIGSRPKWPRMAAILLLPLLAGALYFWRPFRHHTSPAMASNPQATLANAVFTADAGTRKMMTLPDGTRVWLNGGSRLAYDSNMLRAHIRAVTLSGEAFFDVARDKDRCFVIHTDKIDIRVLGTAFNVKAYPQDRITEATLIGGSIELTVNNKPYHKIILKPKEKFALVDEAVTGERAEAHRMMSGSQNRQREKMIVQEITPVEVADKEYVKEVSWVDNEFVFQDETLEELAPRMERWFNVTMEINDPAIRGFHFTGIFQKETIDQALQAMQLIKPFKYKITDNHVYIH